jgi:hypothetical protein
MPIETPLDPQWDHAPYIMDAIWRQLDNADFRTPEDRVARLRQYASNFTGSRSSAPQ